MSRGSIHVQCTSLEETTCLYYSSLKSLQLSKYGCFFTEHTEVRVGLVGAHINAPKQPGFDKTLALFVVLWAVLIALNVELVTLREMEIF